MTSLLVEEGEGGWGVDLSCRGERWEEEVLKASFYSAVRVGAFLLLLLSSRGGHGVDPFDPWKAKAGTLARVLPFRCGRSVVQAFSAWRTK